MEAQYVARSNPPVQRSRKQTKSERILQEFVNGRRLTRFDAEPLGDHCLPSTVSTLKKLGITVRRDRIAIDGKHGRFHCCIYWIDETDRPAAILAMEGGTP